MANYESDASDDQSRAVGVGQRALAAAGVLFNPANVLRNAALPVMEAYDMLKGQPAWSEHTAREKAGIYAATVLLAPLTVFPGVVGHLEDVVVTAVTGEAWTSEIR